MKLLTATKLAPVVGFSRNYIEAVKRQPDSPFRGGLRCDPDVFNEWIVAHPHFRAYLAWKDPNRRVDPRNKSRPAAGAKVGRPRKESVHEGPGAASPPAAEPSCEPSEPPAPAPTPQPQRRKAVTRGQMAKARGLPARF